MEQFGDKAIGYIKSDLGLEDYPVDANQDSSEIGELLDEELYKEHWLGDDLPELGKISFEQKGLMASFPLKVRVGN